MSKGIANNLLKVGAKRRRTGEEIKQQKAADQLKQLNIETKMRQFEEMQRELNELRGQKEILNNAIAIRKKKQDADTIIETLK